MWSTGKSRGDTAGCESASKEMAFGVGWESQNKLVVGEACIPGLNS